MLACFPPAPSRPGQARQSFSTIIQKMPILDTTMEKDEFDCLNWLSSVCLLPFTLPQKTDFNTVAATLKLSHIL